MDLEEKSIKVAKTARYYQFGECGPHTKQLWIVLHGYGQLASYFIKHFEGIANETTCVVAPEGLSRFYLDGKWDRVGATWMTKEDRLHEIEDYITYLDDLLESLCFDINQTPEIVLLGFSQGTATAWRWLTKGKVRPIQLVLWAGGPASDAMDTAALRLHDCGLHFVLGDADEYIKLEDAERQLVGLRALKKDTKLWTFQGNHRMDAPTLERIIASWES